MNYAIMENPDWFTPETLDTSLIKLIDGSERRRVSYLNAINLRDFMLVPNRKENGYLWLNKITKNSFTKDGKRIEGKRHTATFSLDGKNPEHLVFQQALEMVFAKISELVGEQCKKPVSYHGDYMYLFADLIESNEGAVYTSIYNQERLMTFIELTGRYLTRPAFIFTVSKAKRIKMSLQQVYIHEEINRFPLFNKD